MDARAALQEIFAFEQFRPGQEAAVGAALGDRDALVPAIMCSPRTRG